MGFWNDGVRSRSQSRSPSSRSRTRSHRPSQSHAGGRTRSPDSKPQYTSQPSFTRSVSSFISNGGGSTHSQSHSRSRGRTTPQPRAGFVAKIRRFLRKLYDYMRAHPVKVFFLVVMPLITGGVLTKLLAVVGVRLPRSVENMVGSSMGRGAGQGERFFAKGGARDFGGGTALSGMMGGLGALSGAGGMGDAVHGALSIAKMFM